MLNKSIKFYLLWSLLFILFLYYSMLIEILVPSFFGTKKFRTKKLNSIYFFRNILLAIMRGWYCIKTTAGVWTGF